MPCQRRTGAQADKQFGAISGESPSPLVAIETSGPAGVTRLVLCPAWRTRNMSLNSLNPKVRGRNGEKTTPNDRTSAGRTLRKSHTKHGRYAESEKQAAREYRTLLADLKNAIRDLAAV